MTTIHKVDAFGLPPIETYEPCAHTRTDTDLPMFSDESLALRFAERHASDLRYVAAWGRWLLWTGTHWKFDETLAARDRARAVCREAAATCNAKSKNAIASAKTVAAVERLAKADRRLAATIDQWDSNLWLLNTPVGVVDLRTGLIRPARPEDYMTKITAVAPQRDKLLLFNKFLNTITGGDHEFVAYIQRVFGYALTGETREHSLFFAFGTGANGKSVLFSTIAGIFGDYHRAAPIETFTASNSDRHPTELAGLRGARLVMAVETEEGRRWAESRIKTLTGGDKVSARFMRQDYFEYKPQFKLFIAGNHKPGLRSVDEAIRRRFHLLPFALTIPLDERDAELAEKLKVEWAGVLQWLIDGCLEWQKVGLQKPAVVVDATARYLEEEDAVSAWFDEKAERDPKSWEPLAGLFASWSTWAERAGEYVGTARRLSQGLESRGFARHKRTEGQGFLGLRLSREAWSDQHE